MKKRDSIPIETRVRELLARMTLADKLGQMQQWSGVIPWESEQKNWDEDIRNGRIGSFLNATGDQARRFQEIAVKESRLGIPLLFGRDIIHGLRTVLPIPLGLAATFDTGLVEEASRMVAAEALALGLHWTFTPMVDISRDSRWGRVAESAGEDTHLNCVMGAAMVRGLQQREGDTIHGIAACAKHYVGYGAAEGGRDYNTTLIPEGELRDVYLPPFKACVDAGLATVMSGLHDVNGIPASGNCLTLRRILKGEWKFDGMVVSDWGSVHEMINHGYCADTRDAARAGIRAGVDMEMETDCYAKHAGELLDSGALTMDMIDEAVSRILRLKFRLGLFDKEPFGADDKRTDLPAANLAIARKAAVESVVLMKNGGVLPLAPGRRIAVIGPLADSASDMLGCWAMDGRAEDVRTPLAALRAVPGLAVTYAQGLPSARSTDTSLIAEAARVAGQADTVVMFLGEDAIMSGEAHCRAVIDLPGAQMELIEAVKAAGKPLVLVVFAGRALCLGRAFDLADALLYAWHPGVMAGPALADLLLGVESPSGRLPISIPWTVGQIPIYYNKRNTGRPPAEGRRGGIPIGTPLDPKEFCPSYIDADPVAQFGFGFGLSYTRFEYGEVRLSAGTLKQGGTLEASVEITNTGSRHATEVAQLYIRDLVGSRTRPIRELKGFQRVTLAPGERRTVRFTVTCAMLAFHNDEMKLVAEPGTFHLWVSPDSRAGKPAVFELC